MNQALRSQVRTREGNRCEYCLIHQEHDSFFTFPIDHIVARQHGGDTTLGNLALSCFRCNSRKGPNIASIDPLSGRLTELYHPRRARWKHHFEWIGPMINGKTDVGRATVSLLAMNHPDIVLLRELLIEEGTFPPVVD
ncbi:HNH endonuclease [Planctomycetes bacterium Pan216]|uniref:HNH endonuclease n=1 Tax=Kolteria novifilia TaxID=2527975 RepID=A0A518B343_9BACT|nr:HNH endonuclease [Planctomycetes bacterium Pan216]